MRKFNVRWWVTPRFLQWRMAQTDIPLFVYFTIDSHLWERP